MDTRTYQVTPDQVEALKGQLVNSGIKCTFGTDGTSGTLWDNDYQITFAYDGKNLVFTIISKPPFLGTDLVWEKLDKFIPAQDEP